jgi:hypothetical protein
MGYEHICSGRKEEHEKGIFDKLTLCNVSHPYLRFQPQTSHNTVA